MTLSSPGFLFCHTHLPPLPFPLPFFFSPSITVWKLWKHGSAFSISKPPEKHGPMCCGSDWILTWFRNTVASRPTCVEIKKYWQYKRTKKKLSPSPQSVFMALMTSVELCEKFHQEKESCINSSEMWYKDTETCQLAWSVTGWWKPLRSLPSLKYPISASATSPDSLRRDRWKLLRNCWGQFHCLFRKWKKSRKKKKNNVGLSVIENKALFTFWKVL